MAWQLKNKTLQAKLHRLPNSVVRSASYQPLVFKDQKLRDNASLCIFYLPDNFQPESIFHSTDFYNSTHPKGRKPHLQHYIVSSDSLLSSSSASNGITSGSTLPKRPLRRSNEVNRPGPQQSAHGKNIQEVSYQEGSKDRITHTESSRFHFIEIHQGTVGAMLTLLVVFGLLLCCLRFMRFQFLRRQQLWNLRERFLRGYQNPDGDLEMQNIGAEIYRQRQDLESGRLHYPELHGGRFPIATLSQSNLHRNLRQNIARSTSESGYRRPSNTPKNFPMPSPGRPTNQTSFTWESSRRGGSQIASAHPNLP